MTEDPPAPGDDWDGYADGWDRDDDVRLYAAKAFSILESRVLPHFEDAAAIRVLDFGCGTGLLSERLAAICAEVVAVDPSSKMIEVLRAKLAGRLIGNIAAFITTVDAESIKRHPALAGPFDMIVASSVCAFLPDFERTMRDLSTLLKPGGFFVQWDWLVPESEPDTGLPISRIRNAYEAAGLSEIGVEEAFSIDGPDGGMPVLMGIARRPPA